MGGRDKNFLVSMIFQLRNHENKFHFLSFFCSLFLLLLSVFGDPNFLHKLKFKLFKYGSTLAYKPEIMNLFLTNFHATKDLVL
jgi:hypothetical protein